jgi:hypothetical protein
MAFILKDALPQPPKLYNVSIFNQLINKLQLILGINVHTAADAQETEAINFFLSN